MKAEEQKRQQLKQGKIDKEYVLGTILAKPSAYEAKESIMISKMLKRGKNKSLKYSIVKDKRFSILKAKPQIVRQVRLIGPYL